MQKGWKKRRRVEIVRAAAVQQRVAALLRTPRGGCVRCLFYAGV